MCKRYNDARLHESSHQADFERKIKRATTFEPGHKSDQHAQNQPVKLNTTFTARILGTLGATAMPHQCFAYVVLASLISSRVLATPTGRPSVAARYAAMCDDPSLSWDEKKDASCPICIMDSFPMELFDQYCGPTMAPSVTHQYATGVWRRDDGSEDELATLVKSVARDPADDSEVNEEDTKLHALPYLNRHPDLVPVLTDTGKHIRPFPIAMPAPTEPPQTINPRPISEINPGFPADDEIHLASKRNSIQSIEPVDKDLSEHLITSGLWAERHHKAGVIYRREDALSETEPAVSSLPTKAMTAEGDEDFVSKETVASVSDQDPEVSEDQIAMSLDKVTHKPASVIWRREVSRPANNFRLGYPLHMANGRTPNRLVNSVEPLDKAYQKREPSPVPPPEFFEHGHSPSKPLPPLNPNRPIAVPSEDWTTYEAPHVLARQSPGASEPGLGDDYAEYEKQRKKDEKKKVKEEKKTPKAEQIYSTKPPQVWFTPAITHTQVSNIHRRDDNDNDAAATDPQQPIATPDLPLAEKPTWKYTLPWFTPAIAHEEASDIHRRRGYTQPADLDFADGKRPVWTPSLTHMKWPDIHRRGEKIVWVNRPPTGSNPAKTHAMTWSIFRRGEVGVRLS
ncbi:hypothetical protein COCMIDRAFT_24711 [Bipolaris oryzae ATCC 44560]|uniref:Uncharacterized protein n=1 Tax=Bipolaris oryzae ATCC 44560 TaxID=930090 RepID=W6ZC59_COCMI|nr:uncharacterized protein COCMIDRAFT_24711 [Bipolaris oryzae ATCC 44560]EUC47388.1 hypothetical protein COCMIDRAFT_24711 [Bipolaris oryzae ATCC 44560]